MSSDPKKIKNLEKEREGGAVVSRDSTILWEGLDFGTTQAITNMESLLLFLPAFLSVYGLSYCLLFRAWAPDSRPDASSCAISLSHGTPAVFLASRALLFSPTASRSFCSPNAPADNLALEFSIAYFLSDMLHLIVFRPSDVLFIAHHAATLFVFLTCRYLVHHGAYELLVLLILAEITSACQNTWTLARIQRLESAAANKVYESISVPFYAFYTIMRCVLGPAFVYKMGRFYLGDGCRGVVSKWVGMSWLAVIVTAICVSILWVWNNWVEYFREKGKKEKFENKAM
ncbi:hypothetical protein MLD38_013248 [Melastoma candidum]|uniref:Uncharacterized protein n=1 Tax=Melastoma candidum TaxID=119954 RepID=A0ACB9RA36_9MYRT|nr:hypothetical protein MLD38_013248 [Melastoma candidum]